MKRLNGGEFMLDLTPITINESVDSETYTSITNEEVLEQLTLLKKYISNSNGIKPAWIKLRNDETDEEIVLKGEISKVVDDPEFDIHAKLRGFDLTIHVEFTQMLDENDDPIDDWYINTNDAKYLFLSNNIVSVVNNAIVTGDIKVSTKNIYAWEFILANPDNKWELLVSYTDAQIESAVIIINDKIAQLNQEFSVNLDTIDGLDEINNVVAQAGTLDNTGMLQNVLVSTLFFTIIGADNSYLGILPREFGLTRIITNVLDVAVDVSSGTPYNIKITRQYYDYVNNQLNTNTFNLQETGIINMSSVAFYRK